MKWMQYTLTTTTEATDLVGDLLGSLGVEGVEVSDHVPLTQHEKRQMFVDILPNETADDGTATVRFYLEPDKSTPTFASHLRKGLDEISSFVNVGECSLSVTETEDTDWQDNWKAFFKPFRVSDHIVIKPTWESLASLPDRKPSDLVVEIDPGTAFGTGSHETTKLCILALEQYIKPHARILDVGCGSGVLSIVGVLLGADYALGIDVDPHTLPCVYDNRYANHISPDQFHAISGNLLDADEALRHRVGLHQYDVVVANILANVILPLSHEIPLYLKPDGWFVASGILREQEATIRQALEQHFSTIFSSYMGDWVALAARAGV